MNKEIFLEMMRRQEDWAEIKLAISKASTIARLAKKYPTGIPYNIFRQRLFCPQLPWEVTLTVIDMLEGVIASKDTQKGPGRTGKLVIIPEIWWQQQEETQAKEQS